MAEVGQTPAAGGEAPKETVDLFKAAVRAQELSRPGKPQDPLDPETIYNTTYAAVLKSRNTGASISLGDPEQLWEGYKTTPRYSGETGRQLFDADYAGVKQAHADGAALNQTALTAFMPAANRYDRMGIYQDDQSLNKNFGEQDPRVVASMGGGLHYPDSRQKSATMSGYFENQFGQKEKLYKEDLGFGELSRHLVLETQTDPIGKITGPPKLRELRTGESSAGKELISAFGLQDATTNPIWSSIESFFSELGPGNLNLYNDIRRIRYEKLKESYANEMGPENRLTIEQAFNSGTLPSKFLDSWNMPYAVRDMYDKLDKILPRVREYMANEEKYNKLAAEGDHQAQELVKLGRMFDGSDGESFADKLMNELSAAHSRLNYTPSERASMGSFSSLEGATDMIGQGLAFLVPQVLLSTGLASGITRAGVRGLTKEVAAGAARQLTKGGEWTIRAISSGVPTLQMVSATYQSALQAGYSPADAKDFALECAPIWMVAETVVGAPYMIRKWAGLGGKKEVMDAIENSLPKNYIKGDRAGAVGMVRKMVGKMREAPMTGLRSAAEAVWTEGLQEGVEEAGYIIKERWTDQDSKGPGHFGTGPLLSSQSLQRVLSNAVGGAIVGGIVGLGTHHSPYDTKSTIQRLAAMGRGDDVNRMAREFAASGKITSDDANAVAQEVAYAQDLVRSVGANDPYWGSDDPKKDGLAYQYVALNNELKSKQAQLAALKGDGTGKTTAEQQGVEGAIADLEKEIARFTSGEVALSRLKNIYLGRKLSGGVLPISMASRLDSADSIDRVISDFKSYMDLDNKKAAEALQVRDTLKKDMDKAVTDVKDAANPSKAIEDLSKIITEMHRTHALTAEDVKRIDQELSGSRTAMIQEFFSTREEDPMVMAMMHGEEDSVSEEDMLSQYIDLMARPDRRSEFNEQDRKLMAGITAIGGLQRALKAPTEYRDQEHMSRSADPEQRDLTDLATRYFSSTAVPGNADRVPLEEYLRGVEEKQSVLPEEAAQLKATVQQQAENSLALHAMRSVYPDLASDRFAEKIAGSANNMWSGLAPQKQQEFLLDNETLFKPLAKGLPNGFSDNIDSLTKRIAGAVEMAAGRSMMRAASVDLFDQRDLKFRSRLAELFTAFDKDMPAALNTKLDNLLATASLKRGEQDREGERDVILRIEKEISDRLRTSKGMPKKFVSSILGNIDWGDKRTVASKRNYFSTVFLDFPFFDYYNDKITTARGDSPLMGAYIQRLINWTAQLARIDQGVLNSIYGEAVTSIPKGQAIPTTEQEQRIKEVVAAMAAPDDELERSLIDTASIKGDTGRMARNTITVLGHPGTGKTTSMISLVRAMKLIADMNGIDRGRVLILAPSERRIRGVRKMLTDTNVGMDVDVAMVDEVFGEHPGIKLDHDFVIIDEFQSMTTDNADLVKKATHEDARVRSWVLMGDPDQSPPTSDSGRAMALPAWKFGLHTLPLNTSFRTGSVALETFLKDLRDAIHTGNLASSVGSTVYDPIGQHGVQLIDSADPTVMYDRFLADANKEGTHAYGGDALMIVHDTAQYNEAVAYLSRKQTTIDPSRTALITSMVGSLDSSKFGAHGDERAASYVAFVRDDRDHPKMLYTAASRASQQVISLFRGGRSQAVENLPRITGDEDYLPLVRKTTMDRIQASYASLGVDPSEITRRSVRVKPQEREMKGTREKPLREKTKAPEMAPRPKVTTSDQNPVVAPVNEDPVLEKKFPSERPIPIPQSTEPVVIDPTLYTFSSLVDHAAEKGALPAFTATMFFRKGVRQEESPMWTWRKKQIEAISKEPTYVEIRFTRNAKLYAYDGRTSAEEFNGEMLGIYLKPSSEDEKESLNRSRFRYKMLTGTDAPKDATDLELRFLGSIPLNFSNESSSNAMWMRDAVHRVIMSAKTDGEVIPGYESVLIAQTAPGLRVGRPNEVANVPFTELKRSLDERGFHYTSPEQRAAQYKSLSGSIAPAIVMDVAAYATNDPLLTTRVFLWPGKVDDVFIQRMKDDLRSYEDRTSTLSRQDFDQIGVVHLLNNNRSSLIKDGKFTEPSLNDSFVVASGKYIRFKSELDNAQRLSGLSALLNGFISSERGRRMLYKYVRLGRRNPDGTADIEKDDTYDLMSSTVTVNMPHLLLHTPWLAKPTSSSDTPVRTRRAGLPRASVKTSVPGSTTSRNAVQEYLRKVLGNSFVNNSLEFKNRLTDLSGRELWGLMENARILISEDNGLGIRKNVDRHEALHLVVQHLLDDKSRSDLLNEARERMHQEGYSRVEFIKDEEAEEWMARKFEDHRQDTRTLLGRFLRWLDGVLRRWSIYKDRIGQLFEDIDGGHFKDMDPVSTISYAASVKDPDEPGVIPGRSTYGSNDPRQVLVEAFGSYPQVRRLSRDLRSYLLPKTAHAQPTQKNMTARTMTIREAVRSQRQEFIDLAKEVIKEYEVSDGMAIDGYGNTPLNMISGDHVQAMTDAQLEDYYLYRVGNPNSSLIYDSFVRMLMPGTRISTSPDDDQDAPEMSLGARSDSNDERDPWGGMNSVFRMLMTDMDLIDTDPISGTMVESDRPANNDVVREIMQEASFRVNATLVGAVDLEKLVGAYSSALQNIAADDRNGQYGVHAMTLYRRFFSLDGSFTPRNDPSDKAFSYFYAIYDAIERGWEKMDTSEDRGRVSEAILNGITSLATSIIPHDAMMNEVDRNGVINRTFRYGNGSRRALDDLNSSVDRIFQFGSNGTYTVNASMRMKFKLGAGNDPRSDHQFEIKPSGDTYTISDSRGNKIITGQGGKFTIAMAREAATAQVEDSSPLVELIAAMGYDGVSSGAIENMISRSPDRLADLVGHWAMAFRAGILQMEGATASTSTELQQLNKINKQGGGVSTSSLQQLTGYDAQTSSTDGSLKLPRISDLFAMNTWFADANTRSRGTYRNNTYRGVNGNMLFSSSMGTPIRRKLLLAQHADPNTRKEWAASVAMDDPSILVNGTPFNALMNGEMKIDRVLNYKGMSSVSQERSAEPVAMTDMDLHHAVFNAFFSTVFERDINEHYIVPMHLLGDRNLVMMLDISPSVGKLLDLRYSEDGKRITGAKFNSEKLAGYFARNAAYFLGRHQASLARWNAVLGTTMDRAGVITAIEKADPEMIMRSPLVLNSDYVIIGGKISAGPALVMDRNVHRVYNLENIPLLISGNPSVIDRILLDKDGTNAIDMVMASMQRYKLDLRSISNGAYDGQVSSDRELVRSFVYLHHLVDLWASHLAMGDMLSYKSNDWSKRSGHTMTPGQIMVSSYNAVKPRIRIAVREDVMSDQLETFDSSGRPSGIKPYDPGTGQVVPPVESHDGGSVEMPWFHIERKISYGGKEGNLNDTMIKSILVSPSLILKHSEGPVTADSYRQVVLHRTDLFRALGHPQLQKVWVESLERNGFDVNAVPKNEQLLSEEAQAGAYASSFEQAFNSAVNDVMEVAAETLDEQGLPLRGHMIDMVAPTSSVKMGARNIASFGGNDPFVPLEANASDLLLVMNTESDLSDQRVKYSGQFDAAMGILPTSTDLVEHLRAINNVLLDDFLSKVKEKTGLDTSTLSGADHIQMERWMKEIAYQGIDPTSYMSDVADLILKGSSINNPMIREVIMRSFARYALNNGFNPYMRGQMYNSLPGGTLLVDRGNGTLSRLQPARIEGGQYVPGEIAMPFNYVNEFLPPELRDNGRYMTTDEVRRLIMERPDAELMLPIFEKSLDVFISRFPLTTTSAGSYMRIAAFVNDQKNVIYVPPETNALAGSDHDGDKWAVYQFNVTRRGGVIDLPGIASDREKRKGAQNDILQAFIDYYRDTRNSKIYFHPTGAGRVVNFHASIADKLPKGDREVYDLPSFLASPTRVFGPKEIVGVSAVAIKSYGYLSQAYNALSQQRSPHGEKAPVPVNLTQAKVSPAQRRHLLKDNYKSQRSNKFIGRGNGATGEYARLSLEAGKEVNSGNYSRGDVVFVSANGARPGGQDIDREEILRAVNAGSVFLTDGKESRPEGGNTYNVGEQQVADLLRENGYTEVEEYDGLVARWFPPQQEPTEQRTPADAVFRGWKPKLNSAGGTVVDDLSQFINACLDDPKHMVLGDLGIDPVNVSLILGKLLKGVGLEKALEEFVSDERIAELSSMIHASRSIMDPFRGFNSIGNLLVSRMSEPDLLDDHVTFEAVTRMNAVFNLRRQLPSGDLRHLSTLRAIRMLIKPELYESFYLKPYENTPTAFAMRSMVRQKIDAKGTLAGLPTFSKLLDAFDVVNAVYEQTLLPHHPSVKALSSRLMKQTSIDPVDDQRVFNGFMELLHQGVIADHLANAGTMVTSPMGGMPIDLRTRDGMMRWTMEFPAMMHQRISDISLLPVTDPRYAELQNNRFLRSLSIAPDGSLQLPDTSWMRDPAVRHSLTMGISTMDKAMEEHDGVPFSNWLTTYALVKERLGLSARSLTALLPAGSLSAIDARLNDVFDSLSDQNGFLDRMITRNNVDGFLAANAYMVPVLTQSLQPNGSYGYDQPSTTYYWLRHRKGDTVTEQVMKEGRPLNTPASRGTMAYDAISDPVTKLPVIKRLDPSTYRSIIHGEKNIQVNSYGDPGTGTGSVLTPYGPVNVTSYKDGVLSIDASPMNSVSGGSTSILNMAERLPEDSDQFDTIGDLSSIRGSDGYIDFKDVLDHVISTTKEGSMRSIAELLRSNEEAIRRVTSFEVFNEERKVGDRTVCGTYHRGIISVWSGTPKYLFNELALHEGLHAYVNTAIDKDGSSSLDHERRFHREVKKIHDEWKRASTNKDLKDNYNDLQEFATGAFIDPELQEDLVRNVGVSPKAKQGFLRWLIRAIGDLVRKALFLSPNPQQVNDGVIGHLMSLITDYATEQSSKGSVDITKGSPSFMARRKRVQVDDVPITDVRQVADELRSKTHGANYENMSDQQLIDHFLNNYDWTQPTVVVAGIEFVGMAGASREELRNTIREDVLPRVTKFNSTERRRAFYQALVAGGEAANFVKDFPDRSSINGALFSDRMISRLVDKMGHSPTSYYMLYSDLQDPERVLENGLGERVTVKELGLSHIDGMRGYDPIIKMDKIVDGGWRLSLYDLTANPFGRKMPGEVRGRLFSDHVPSISNENLSTTGNNGEAGIRSFILAMTMMGLKKNSEKIQTGGMAAFSLRSSDLEISTVWMPDVLKDLKIFRSLPIASRLSESIRTVVNDERLYGDIYKQGGLDDLYAFMREHQDGTDMPLSVRVMHDQLLTRSERYLNGTEGDPAALMEALRFRQNWLEKQYDMDTVLQNRSDPHGEEYHQINKAIYWIKNSDRWGSNTAKDLTAVKALFTNPHNLKNDIVQWVVREVVNTMNIVSARVKSFRREHNQKMKEYSDSIGFSSSTAGISKNLLDVGWTQFESLWKWSVDDDTQPGTQVRDASGALKKSFLGELHWDRKDPATIKALQDGTLTEKGLEYSNWLLDQVHDMYVRLRVHNMRNDADRFDFWRADGTFDQEKATQQAETYVNKNWKRGLMPLVNKPPSELMVTGGVNKVLGSWWKKMSDPYTVFDEDFSGSEIGNLSTVGNQFTFEISGAEPNHGLGSSARMVKLGISHSGSGGFFVDNESQNNNLTHNIELMITYFMMAGERKIAHESRSLPVLRSGRQMLMDMKRASDNGQENNLNVLKRWSQRMINARISGNERIAGVDVESFINGAMAVTSFTRVGFSAPVAFASLLHNLLTVYGTAVANSASRNDLFGVGDLSKAMSLYHGSAAARNKMAAIADRYNLFESSEHDVANLERYSKTRNLLFSQSNAHFMARWTDNMIRSVVAAAQMMKDGTWDAFDVDGDQIVYDEKKDRRFFNEDGSFKSDDARKVHAFVRKQLMEDGIWDQTREGSLKAPYSLSMGSMIKWISDKYVIGGMDASTQTIMNTYSMGRLFMQFKNYMPDKLANAFGSSMYSEQGGRPAVMEDEKGDRKAYWVKRQTMGYISAIGEMTRKLHEANYQPISAWNNMSEAARWSFTRSMYDLAVFLSLMALYGYLSGWWEDDDKKRGSAKTRPVLVRKLLQTSKDFLTMNPITASNQFSQGMLPSMDMIMGWQDAMFGNTNRIQWNIPGYGTYRAAKEAFDLAKDRP